LSSLVDALVEAHEILEGTDVAHALCGGIAANLYREDVRATMDVDFYLVVGAAELVGLARTFEAAGWRAQPYWRKAELLRMEKHDTPRVDCLIASTDYERSAIRRAVEARVEGTRIPVLTPEDLIVFKLVAGRARDYEAVAAIVNAMSDDLDVDYVVDILERLGISDRWARASDEAARERG
jgi:uncharacterized nucleotidyltransferase DUF6036